MIVKEENICCNTVLDVEGSAFVYVVCEIYCTKNRKSEILECKSKTLLCL